MSGNVNFIGTQEEWDALVEKNKLRLSSMKKQVTPVEYLEEQRKWAVITNEDIAQAKKLEEEQMYSEEEVLAFGQFCIGKVADFLNGKGDQTDGQEHSMEELFEKFKKK